jgi:hypothetical protein
VHLAELCEKEPAVRFVAITVFQSSSVVSDSGFRCMIPAFETMASILTKALAVSPIKRFTSSSFETSHATARPPADAAVSSTRAAFTSAQTQAHPCLESSTAQADPVTRARDDRDLGVIRLHANFPFCAIML